FLAVVVCVRSPFFRVKWLILPGQPVTPRKRYSINPSSGSITCFSASRTCSSVTATVSTPFALWLHSKGCPAAAQLRRLRRRSPLPWPCRAPYNGGQIRQEPIGNGRRAGCTSQDKGG